MAILRLQAAGIEESFGRAILDMLKKQYPDQAIGLTPSQVGGKLMNIALKENQRDPERAKDTIQNFFEYLTKKQWDFRKDFPKWEDALDAIYTNVRRRAITKSIETQRTKKRTKSVDDAFGVRGEEGGAAEGGEGRMPTPGGTDLGVALDDKAAIKRFHELMEENIPLLRESLPVEQRVLFDLVFDDNVGTFSSNIESNMGQATALKEKLESGSPEEKAIYEKNAKRWSGFVGDTRKKLLDSIQKFVESEMTPEEVDILWDEFYSDTTPGAVHRQEKQKEKDKAAYQRGIDERKLARLKWQKDQGSISPADAKSLSSLEKKFKDEYGVDPATVPAAENPEGSAKKKKAASLNEVVRRVAAAPARPAWA